MAWMLFCLFALAFSTTPTTISGRANRVLLLNHPQLIHTHGGLVLDIPSWLEDIERQGDDLRSQGLSMPVLQARVSLWREAILRAQQDTSIAPEMIAELQIRLWDSLDDMGPADNPQIQKEEISLLETALPVYKRDRYPFAWAGIQHHLGYTYSRGAGGSNIKDAEDIEQAITCYNLALQVRHHDDVLADWALTQRSIAWAYMTRVYGDRAENQENAITAYLAALQYYTQANSPSEWVNIQANLSDLYTQRIQGDPGENIEKAIACCSAALEVYTRTDFPAEWAKCQKKLAYTYYYRLQGCKVD